MLFAYGGHVSRLLRRFMRQWKNMFAAGIEKQTQSRAPLELPYSGTRQEHQLLTSLKVTCDASAHLDKAREIVFLTQRNEVLLRKVSWLAPAHDIKSMDAINTQKSRNI
jgi:hypothetical protein